MPQHFDPQHNNHLFASIVDHYDFCNHFFSLNIDQHWRRQLVKIEGLQGSARILDLCTGTGDVAFQMRRYNPQAQVVGLDVSHAMLCRARQKQVSRAGADRLTFVEGDGLTLPFREETFDAVLVSFGLRNQVEYVRALREMQRVLNSGGVLRILEFAPPGRSGLQGLYRFYLKHCLPVVGGLVTRQKKAYTYLAHSIERFLTPQELQRHLADMDFIDVQAVGLSGGIVYLYTAKKK